MFRHVKLTLLYRRPLFTSLCKLHDSPVESGFLGHVTQVKILVGGDVDEVQGEGEVSDPHPSAVAPGPLLSSHDLLTPEQSAVPALPKSFLGHPVWNNFKDPYMLTLLIYLWFKVTGYYYKFENILFDTATCKSGMNH